MWGVWGNIQWHNIHDVCFVVIGQLVQELNMEKHTHTDNVVITFTSSFPFV
jgi:hypothetical protein